ncbi:protein CBFA2T3-like [Bolinopsis microptera]|uniref:protein CBFA2T3-like n=1 Tax=Bolinopsis microptera TaxID=2820187 RepID=UPI003079C8D2
MKPFLSETQMQIIVQSLIISSLDYCNALYFGANHSVLKQLQSLQNRACRLVKGLKKREEVDPYIKELHWLKVQERIEFKILLLTFKLLHGLAPSYLSNLVKYNSSGGRDVSLHCPINSPPRAFSSSAPRLWNNLPQEIRKCVNIKDFKGKLKAHLMKMPGPLDETVSCYFTLARPLAKLKRLLTTIQQTANNISPQVSESVQTLIVNLVNNVVTPEDFQNEVQNQIQFSLKQFVVPFLTSTLPLLQEEIHGCRKHEMGLDNEIGEKVECSRKRSAPVSPISSRVLKQPCLPPSSNKITIKRALLISSCLKILSHELEKDLTKLKEDNVTEETADLDLTNELNILTSLLSCLSDSEHTQTIISEVKTLLKTVCEESVERARADLTAQSDDKDQSCWNCGRKASESCSGCKDAKYCGTFCQLKHWEAHHKTCKTETLNSNDEDLS